MTEALLDTSVVIAFADPREPTPDLTEFEATHVSSLTWHELTLGLHAARDIAEYRRRTQALTTLRSVFGAGLAYDDVCTAAADRLLARVVERGGILCAHTFDRMIAATAIANGMTLVTRNAADLRGFDGLLQVVER